LKSGFWNNGLPVRDPLSFLPYSWSLEAGEMEDSLPGCLDPLTSRMLIFRSAVEGAQIFLAAVSPVTQSPGDFMPSLPGLGVSVVPDQGFRCASSHLRSFAPPGSLQR
jgi:hypothetical protein